MAVAPAVRGDAGIDVDADGLRAHVAGGVHERTRVAPDLQQARGDGWWSAGAGAAARSVGSSPVVSPRPEPYPAAAEFMPRSGAELSGADGRLVPAGVTER